MEADGRLSEDYCIWKTSLETRRGLGANNIHWWCRWRSQWNTCSLQPIEVNLSIKSPEHTDTPGFLLTFPKHLTSERIWRKFNSPLSPLGYFGIMLGELRPQPISYIPWLFMRIVEDKYSSKGSFLSYNDQYVNVLLSHCVGLIPLKNHSHRQPTSFFFPWTLWVKLAQGHWNFRVFNMDQRLPWRVGWALPSATATDRSKRRRTTICCP